MIVLSGYQRQLGNAHDPELAREGHRLVPALLLGKAGDDVIAGIIDLNATALPDREPTRPRKPGVTEVVLRAHRSWGAELCRPPLTGRSGRGRKEADSASSLALRLGLRVRPRIRKQGLAPHQRRQLVAERVDAVFEALVEHVANHDHPTLGPLAHSTKIGVTELRLGPVPERQRTNKRDGSIKADAVPTRNLFEDLASLRCQILHRHRLPERVRCVTAKRRDDSSSISRRLSAPLRARI